MDKDIVKDEKEKEKEKPKKLKVPELQEKIADLESKLLYLQADYQNFRKRTAKDLQEARIYGAANALEPFLRINDFLAMAQMAAEQSDNVEAIKQGVLMIINEYNKAMDELGVKKIKTAGEKFDPDYHEALSQESSETVPEGNIIREFSGGYKMGERLLRPARVVVSSGKVKDAPQNAETTAPVASDESELSENFKEE